MNENIKIIEATLISEHKYQDKERLILVDDVGRLLGFRLYENGERRNKRPFILGLVTENATIKWAPKNEEFFQDVKNIEFNNLFTTIGAYVNHDEYELIASVAAKHGISIGDYVKDTVIKQAKSDYIAAADLLRVFFLNP